MRVLLCALQLLQLTVFCVAAPDPPWEQHLGSLRATASPADQQEAVEGLLHRLLPDFAANFSIVIDSTLGPSNRDTFRVLCSGGQVEVWGSSGVAASWGVLHYLKTACHAHVSWQTDQLRLPRPLPSANFTVTSLDKYRYYKNVCTASYSMAWWDWQRWQREVDWMALNGINLPLASLGTEALWARVYTQLGLTQADLDQFFVGPAFLAWGRMGNLEQWGGPLSAAWHNKTLALQRQVVARMRQFGMTPVLPAFAGHVPKAFTRIFPQANVTKLAPWGHFTEPYTETYLLDPRDPLFQTIGKNYLEEQTRQLGTDHLYSCDTFNEMLPPSSDPAFLQAVGQGVYQAMTVADPQAVWVMQAWLFVNEPDFWGQDQAKALLTSVAQGRMLVLDLAAEVRPQYKLFNSFYGQPFIFCLLHNYGGVLGLFGNVQVLLKNLEEARHFPNVSLVGTGLTPEGINQNYVMYDLMTEMAWRTTPPHIPTWAVSYARRRYGSDDPRLGKAWQLLMDSVYNCQVQMYNNGQYILVNRPEEQLEPDKLWYSVADLVAAWDLMIASANTCCCHHHHTRPGPGESTVRDQCCQAQQAERGTGEGAGAEVDCAAATLQHDLVDVTRQMLQLVGGQMALRLVENYRNQVPLAVKVTSSILQDLLQDLDQLLGSSPDFLLGSWVKDAASWASTEQERQQYVFNALNQITLWGPTGEIVDYAVKQWAGLVSGYIAPRWALFARSLLDAVEGGQPFDQHQYNWEVFSQVEEPFTKNVNASFPTQPQGDSVVLAVSLHSKYRPVFSSSLIHQLHQHFLRLTTKHQSKKTMKNEQEKNSINSIM